MHAHFISFYLHSQRHSTKFLFTCMHNYMQYTPLSFSLSHTHTQLTHSVTSTHFTHTGQMIERKNPVFATLRLKWHCSVSQAPLSEWQVSEAQLAVVLVPALHTQFVCIWVGKYTSTALRLSTN